MYGHVITKFSRMGRLHISLAMGLCPRAVLCAAPRASQYSTNLVRKTVKYMQLTSDLNDHFKSVCFYKEFYNRRLNC